MRNVAGRMRVCQECCVNGVVQRGEPLPLSSHEGSFWQTNLDKRGLGITIAKFVKNS